MDLTPRPLGENEMEPSRRAAYDAVNELIRQDPEARMWRAVAVALAAALPIERRAGREDAAEAVWAKSQELRGKPFRSGEVGIEYVNGMEDATEIAGGSGDR